jgi:molybdopterin molybdotransferase
MRSGSPADLVEAPGTDPVTAEVHPHVIFLSLTEIIETMPLLAFSEAKARLLASARAVAETETLDLADAHGRVLAEDLISTMTVPPFSNAAMDGYAVRAADVGAVGTRLPVSQRVAAGDVAQPLDPGTAARIFTGAQVPEGADSVVMQEDCQADGDQVIVNQAPPIGQHVRLKGSDLTAGKPILAAGSPLTAAAMGLAASVGIATVKVFRRLKVAIFFTGSELVMPGQPLPPGHIYNSNRYVMRGFLQGLGAEVVDLGAIRDDRQATQDALRRAADAADLIVTSGGMSEGEEDHVTAAVQAEGHIDVWKIAAKPGKPLAFGGVRAGSREAAFIGLPGNPVSVWSGLLTLVAPYLRCCQGLSRIEPEPFNLRADFSYTVKGNRMEFVRVRRNARGGLDIYPTQDSAIISSAVWADGVSPIAAGHTVKPGDLVEFLPGPGWTP